MSALPKKNNVFLTQDQKRKKDEIAMLGPNLNKGYQNSCLERLGPIWYFNYLRSVCTKFVLVKNYFQQKK